MARVALVCSQETAGGAVDDLPLATALRERGCAAEHVRWDDAAAEWSAFDVALIRSTWDYHLRLHEFLAWVERVAALTRLVNDSAIVRWNADKRYLLDLERAGVAITPSVVVDGAADLGAIVRERGWGRFVVKPTVSATAFGTERFGIAEVERAQGHLDRLLVRGPALVQRYEAAIEGAGERSVMVIGGVATHCVVKRPKAGDFRCQSDFGGTVERIPLTREDAAVALRAVEAAPRGAAYARVDLIDTPEGARVMEMEMIEPEMFFRFDSGAAERMVAATISAAGSPAGGASR